MVELVCEEEKTYYSSDSVCKTSSGGDELDTLYPIEFLNSLNFNGFPQHELRIKKNIPIMLLRNINPSIGLCNGTRLIIIELGVKIIEAIILTGSHCGTKVFIPRIVLTYHNNKWPFILKRRQFPIRICYCMTINKSQGQTLERVGLYLHDHVFTHGQLYVALSRVTSYNGIKILINKQNTEEYDNCIGVDDLRNDKFMTTFIINNNFFVVERGENNEI